MMKNTGSCRGTLLLCGLAILGCGAPSEGAGATVEQPPPSVPPSTPVSGSAQPLFDGKVVNAEHVAPVAGGTLLVTRSGKTIVAADPDRDALFLVDTKSHAKSTLSLERGAEPGRLVEGSEGVVYVALRRAGALLAIDTTSRQVLSRVPVCAAPRGLDYDAAHDALYVACRSGQLITLDAKSLSTVRTVQLDTDLRDVIARENELVVTRFLSSEVLVIASDGSVVRRATPTAQGDCAEATVAFRALNLPNGLIALAHQSSSDLIVSEDSGGYGFSCGGSLVTRTLTLVDVDHGEPDLDAPSFSTFQDPRGANPELPMTFQSTPLPAAGPLDVAFDTQSGRIAAIALENSLAGQTKADFADPSQVTATLWLVHWDGQKLPDFSGQGSGAAQGVVVPGQPVAVVFDNAGKYVVQTREPATLEFEGGAKVSLSAESHADSGASMFYMNSGIGISCSSCHPEGGEDGHVWRFNEGLRRTLPLEGGVLERAPFHWDGALGDMNALVNEVMLKRMALPVTPSKAQVAALGSFLEQLPRLAAADGSNAIQVQRGRLLFERKDVGCVSCHGGPQYTNNQLVDVGTGGAFVTPSLIGVGLRSRLFHDGCAPGVNERFGACGGSAHGKPELLSAVERTDLIAFLRSL